MAGLCEHVQVIKCAGIALSRLRIVNFKFCNVNIESEVLIFELGMQVIKCAGIALSRLRIESARFLFAARSS